MKRKYEIPIEDMCLEERVDIVTDNFILYELLVLSEDICPGNLLERFEYKGDLRDFTHID